MADLTRLRYRAIDATGRTVSGIVQASDRADAVRRLAADRLTAVEIKPAEAVATNASGSKKATLADRLLVVRQLSIMLGAGVPLLGALESVATAFPNSELGPGLANAMRALRRGDRLGKSFAEHVPGFPAYVYAMLDVGEETGRLPEVLRQAADQMSFDDRLGRDVGNALAYPMFLAAVGTLAVAFLFFEVVPRFSTMIGDDRSKLPFVSAAVFAAGDFTRANWPFIVAIIGGAIMGIGAMAAIPQFRALGASVARAMPILGRILKSRDLAGWTRLVGFGLSNGLILLKALDLAKAGVADPNWRARLVQVERALRSGADVDEALAPNTPLSVVDLSVVRTGQRSGALGPMFLLLADNYEADVKDLVRRATALIEPIALAMVAGVVGTIAVALALALSSIYDTVG